MMVVFDKAAVDLDLGVIYHVGEALDGPSPDVVIVHHLEPIGGRLAHQMFRNHLADQNPLFKATDLVVHRGEATERP
jgi:hypothetical protein